MALHKSCFVFPLLHPPMAPEVIFDAIFVLSGHNLQCEPSFKVPLLVKKWLFHKSSPLLLLHLIFRTYWLSFAYGTKVNILCSLTKWRDRIILDIPAMRRLSGGWELCFLSFNYLHLRQSDWRVIKVAAVVLAVPPAINTGNWVWAAMNAELHCFANFSSLTPSLEIENLLTV